MSGEDSQKEGMKEGRTHILTIGGQALLDKVNKNYWRTDEKEKELVVEGGSDQPQHMRRWKVGTLKMH